jgi:hypothetical protein
MVAQCKSFWNDSQRHLWNIPGISVLGSLRIMLHVNFIMRSYVDGLFWFRVLFFIVWLINKYRPISRDSINNSIIWYDYHALVGKVVMFMALECLSSGEPRHLLNHIELRLPCRTEMSCRCSSNGCPMEKVSYLIVRRWIKVHGYRNQWT